MTCMQNSMKQSFISVKSFTREKVMHYIKKAEKYENNSNNSKNLKTMINLFYEPSTRTSCSFHTAMIKMGGNIIGNIG